MARENDMWGAPRIHAELSALKRMFSLAVKDGQLKDKPYISMLKEKNTRKGFFERRELDAVLANLSEDLRPVFEVAYFTGWRVRSEILTRQWHHVSFDRENGYIRLEPDETKNDDGREFPMIDELRAVLERQRERTRFIERKIGRFVPWVFHREGRPIKEFRKAWDAACRKAEVGDRIPHDLRRTAVRNLEQAGVPRSAAMAMVGHRTESIYRRYAITDKKMIDLGAEKLNEFFSPTEIKSQNRQS